MKAVLTKHEEVDEAINELRSSMVAEMEAHEDVKNSELRVKSAHKRVLMAKDTIRSLSVN